VLFKKSYSYPVVLLGAYSRDGGDASTVRLTKVDDKGFEV